MAYGYKTADTGTDMTVDQNNTFRIIGQQQMAAINGYKPEQSSDLYIADGTIIDWTWQNQGIFAYTFELYPTGSPGFYPPDEQIAPQTQRNREAFLMLSEYADYVYRAIGKQAQYCNTGPPPVTVFSDTFETATGRTVNLNATDTAPTRPTLISSGRALSTMEGLRCFSPKPVRQRTGMRPGPPGRGTSRPMRGRL